MNLASLLGLLLTFVTTVFGITFVMDTSSFNFSLIMNFWDVPAILITFGGSLFAMLVMQRSAGAFFYKLSTFRLVFRNDMNNEYETIRTIIALSNVARKEGLLALEEATNEIEDNFLKKGVLLIVDGTDPDLVRGIMDTELGCIEERYNEVSGFWDSLELWVLLV